MMDKIDQFLFDLIGLLAPGALFILIPAVIFAIVYDWNTIFNILNNFIGYFDSLKTPFAKWLIIIPILAFFYLFGHVVKICSVRFYNFGKAIFDKNLNPACNEIIKKIGSVGTSLIKDVLEESRDILAGAFKFSAAGYDSASERYYEQVLETLAKDYDIDLREEKSEKKLHYAIYKLAGIFRDNENVKTLSSTFLAKYNFYRSMSFIFFINIIFTLCLIFKYRVFDYKTAILLVILVLFSYSFHEKYKRYWTLSGNEALMGVYYYLCMKGKENDKTAIS